jgi:septum formation topological specificity factor MinE
MPPKRKLTQKEKAERAKERDRLIVARQRLGKIPQSLLGNLSVKIPLEAVRRTIVQVNDCFLEWLH